MVFLRKKFKKAIGGVSLAALVIVSICAAVYYWPKPGASVDLFSVDIVDPLNPSVPLDLSDFDLTLMGLKPDKDPESAASWESVTGFTDLSDLTAAKVESAFEDYDALYAIYNGTVVNDEDTYDDEFGDRTYGSRQAPIINGANHLVTYVTPNVNASFLIINDATGALITDANITTAVNFTVIEYLNNMSIDAYDQAFVAYTDYTGEVICTNIIVTLFDHDGTEPAVTIADLTAEGFTVAKEAHDQLKFSDSYLGATPHYHHFAWGADAIDEHLLVTPANATGFIQYRGTAAI